MRILPALAVAAVAAGLYHYRGHYRGRYRSRSSFREDRPTDDVLAERVRLSIGGAASNPVQVTAADGIVTLRGRVRSRAESDLVVAAALAVPGVTQVTNYLETQDQPQVSLP